MIYEDVFNYSQPAWEPYMYVIISDKVCYRPLSMPIIDYVAILTQLELQPSRILSFSLRRIVSFTF